MKDIILNLLKPIRIFKTLLIFAFFLKTAYAEVYNEIIVDGNDRLSVETIIMFSGIKTGQDLSDNDLNNSIKNLYKTNYFKDINLSTSDKVIRIEIVENPIIQNIKINGVKNKAILEKLKKITKKNEKYPYLKNKILDQNNLLLNIIRATGFYFAKIETNVIDNKNNC